MHSVDESEKSDKGRVYVVDERRHDFYIIDNTFIRDYGRHIGPYAIATYNCLACRAGKKRVAWPSYRTIGTEIGASRSTAMRAIAILEEWKMIWTEHRPPEEGQKEHENNRYHLTDCATWKPLPDLTETGGISQEPPDSLQEPPVVAERHRGSVTETPKEDAVKEDEDKEHINNNTVDVAPLANALFAAGIRPRSLCASLARIPGAARQLEWYPLRRGEVAKWGPGVLRKSIEEDWAPPKSAATENHANGHSAPKPTPEEAAAHHARQLQAAQQVYDELPLNDRRPLDIEAKEKGESVLETTLRRKLSDVNIAVRGLK